jgi:hypothetical protein
MKKKWLIEESIITDVADTVSAFVAPESVRVVPDDVDARIILPMNAMHDLVDVVFDRDRTTRKALVGKALLIALAHTARIDRRFREAIAVEAGTTRSVRLSLRVHAHTHMTRSKAENVDVNDGFGPALIVAESCSIVVDDGVSEAIIPIPDPVGFGVVIVPDDTPDVSSLRPDASFFLRHARLVVHPMQYPHQSFDEFLVETFNAARMAIITAMPDAHASFDWDDDAGDDVVVEEDEASESIRYTLPLHLPFIFHACAQLERSIMLRIEDLHGMMNVFRSLHAAGATRMSLDDGRVCAVFDDGTAVQLIAL